MAALYFCDRLHGQQNQRYLLPGQLHKMFAVLYPKISAIKIKSIKFYNEATYSKLFILKLSLLKHKLPHSSFVPLMYSWYKIQFLIYHFQKIIYILFPILVAFDRC